MSRIDVTEKDDYIYLKISKPLLFGFVGERIFYRTKKGTGSWFHLDNGQRAGSEIEGHYNAYCARKNLGLEKTSLEIVNRVEIR